MKLLDLTPYFHRKSGGIKKFILKKAQYLPAYGVQHTVVIPGEDRKEFIQGSTKFYQLPSLRIPLSGGYRFFKSVEDIKRIIRTERPQVVELGGTYLLASLFEDRDFLLSVFYHSDARGEMSFLPIPKKVKNMLFSALVDKCLSRADVILTPTEKYRRELLSLGLPKVYRVSLGVEVDTFSPKKRNRKAFKERYLVEEDKVVLLYVGRFSVDKRVDFLLKVFENLKDKDFHMVMVGDGPLKAYVKLKAKGIKNLTLIEYISSEEELAFIYANCDIFVSASPFETFGFAFLEAQSSGLILVALDMDLETQLIKDFLVKNYSPHAFLQAIHRAREHLSPSMRDFLHEMVRQTFSWKVSIERYLQIYPTFVTL